MKITKVLGDNKYEVRVEPFDTNTHPINFGVAHDYVLFSTYTSLFTEGDARIPMKYGGTTNTLQVPSSVQLNIRIMGEVILPKLIENKYLQPEHYKKYGIWDDAPITNWADSETVTIYDKGQKKFIEISRELYKQLHTKP